ncbi:MAG: glucose 1-dehydrogenase [Chloroflexi bacterium]|nr:glucose 1-dehydrogenase [Chloroflexota bacterium]MCC6895824.1 glucose 1-dehydrogenase [Anaerolineae bacterium]
MPDFSLHGKVAVVTGASRGIGEAVARTYAQAGAKVVLVSRKLDGVTSVADSIRQQGGVALPVAAHMGDPAAVAALVEQAAAAYGGIDIVVNNAGTNPHFGPLLTADEGVWEKTLDVNLHGTFRLIRAAVPSMIGRGGGKVINIASIAGLTPMPGVGLYGISKAAVMMMTKVLAVELAQDNIQVNAIAPGFVKTKFSQAIWGDEQVNAAVVASTPAGRIAGVEDLQGMMLYLASSASSFLTGQVITIDGGLTLSPGSYGG